MVAERIKWVKDETGKLIQAKKCSNVKGTARVPPCSRLGQWLPLTEFYPRPERPLGWNSECRECMREKTRQWRRENKGKERKRQRQYSAKQKALHQAKQAHGLPSPPGSPERWFACPHCGGTVGLVPLTVAPTEVG